MYVGAEKTSPWRTAFLLLLCSLTIHDQVPGRAVHRHLKLEAVGGGRKDFLRELSLHCLWSHFHFAVPCPGIAFDCSLEVIGFSHAVVLIIGIDILLRVVAHHGNARPITRAALEAGVEHDEEVAVHPLALFLNSDLAAGAHRTGFHVSLRSPTADKVPDLLYLRSRLRRSLSKG